MIAPLLVAALAGLALGSFLNVVIHRLPRGEAHRAAPLALPGLRGADRSATTCRCSRGCCCGDAAGTAATAIPARYPLVEALTAGLFVAVVAAKGADRDIWLGLVLVTALVPITFIDLDHRIIPNRITLPRRSPRR